MEKFDSETISIINYLKTRNEVCDLNINEASGVNKNQISEWELRNYCCLPEDLKSFYLNHNGMLIQWKVKIDNSLVIPLGKIQINSLRDLTRVGSVLTKDYSEPSIFDLDDLQEPPKELLEPKQPSNLTEAILKGKLGNDIEHNDLNDGNTLIEEFNMDFKSDNLAIFSDEENDNFEQHGEEVDDFQSIKAQKNAMMTLLPHFDESSRNFELDNCNGYGKVCLVYRNSKPGIMCSEQSAEIWFLDRSFQWHFLTSSFKNYYRLLIAHLGLPQWQTLFTEDGLPPFLEQWYYLFAPGRVLIHDENWKKFEFLNLLENNVSSTAANKKPPAQQQQQHQQNQPQQPPNSKKKIDFTKLFDEKNSKNKSQNANSTNNPGQTDKNMSNSVLKSKSKINIRK